MYTFTVYIINMLSKITYAVQPYQVGHKDRKSLAIIIPAKVTKECNINPSTIFAIQIDQQRNSIMLQRIDAPYQKDVMPTGENLQATNQQVSTRAQNR
jgi:hypothetical protein